MIKWWRRWRAKKRHEKQLRECQEDGHFLVRAGEMQEARMVGGAPVPLDKKPEFEIFGCKCGYHEVNDAGTKAPYRRDYLDGERLKKTASIGHNITDGGAIEKG